MSDTVTSRRQFDDLLAGFSEPVAAGQQVFRCVLDAMSRPGKVVSLPTDQLPPAPEPLQPATMAVLLTLCDLDTPLWLDAAAQAEGALVDHLKFHLSAPLMGRPHEATFAVVTECDLAPPLAHFKLGTDAAPETSTTVIIQLVALGDEAEGKAEAVDLLLAGPGIKQRAKLSLLGVKPSFEECLRQNAEHFPRGIDVILVAGDRVAALPRSIQVLEEAR